MRDRLCLNLAGSQLLHWIAVALSWAWRSQEITDPGSDSNLNEVLNTTAKARAYIFLAMQRRWGR